MITKSWPGIAKKVDNKINKKINSIKSKYDNPNKNSVFTILLTWLIMILTPELNPSFMYDAATRLPNIVILKTKKLKSKLYSSRSFIINSTLKVY